ncbi:hypothetical protein F4859DRAFT_516635 [Xylaria cf. heliscus]|nr:hypothetical protein F4859DRAFT_516635 [Xylaria cf. heliscus]
MSQPSEQRPRKRQPKPPKLRSACNQCNAAKVKCSGERDGCVRCKTLQNTCLYAESRVGKVQGPRLRQKSLAAQNTSKDPAPMTQPTPSPDMIEAHVSPDSPSSHAFSHTGQHTHSWPEPWESGEVWTSGVQMLGGPYSGLTDLLGEEDLLPANTPASGGGRAGDGRGHANNDAGTIHCSLSAAMDVSSSPSESSSASPAALQIYHNGGIASPTSPTSITQDLSYGMPTLHPFSTVTPPPTQKSQPAAAPQLEMAEKELARLNSRCALACTHIIATLESYLLLELKALDLILEVTRKAAGELEKLVHLQKEARCGRCIILFVAALSQITELLDTGTKQLPDSGVGFQSRFHPGLQMAFMPSLGFGAFSFGAEEQLSMRLSLIRRECRHIGKILANVEALATTGTAMLDPRTTCLKSLKQRLEEMCDGHN